MCNRLPYADQQWVDVHRARNQVRGAVPRYDVLAGVPTLCRSIGPFNYWYQTTSLPVALKSKKHWHLCRVHIVPVHQNPLIRSCDATSRQRNHIGANDLLLEPNGAGWHHSSKV